MSVRTAATKTRLDAASEEMPNNSVHTFIDGRKLSIIFGTKLTLKKEPQLSLKLSSSESMTLGIG